MLRENKPAIPVSTIIRAELTRANRSGSYGETNVGGQNTPKTEFILEPQISTNFHSQCATGLTLIVGPAPVRTRGALCRRHPGRNKETALKISWLDLIGRHYNWMMKQSIDQALFLAKQFKNAGDVARAVQIYEDLLLKHNNNKKLRAACSR